MRRLQGKMLLLSGAVLSLLLLQACGQNSAAEGSGEAFAAAAEASPEANGLTQAQASASPAPQASAEAPEVTAQPSTVPDKASGTPVALQPSPLPSPASSAEPVAETAQAIRKPSGTAEGSAPSPAASAAATTTRQPASAKDGARKTSEATATPAAKAIATAIATKAPKATPAPATAASPSAPAGPSAPAKVAKAAEAVSAGRTEINWNGFFDGDDQTRPSEHFWDLSGQQVTIKGFMGEVLSFEKNWFLLIPEPGAECPFDNGDETYWNKIMIVFVPEGSKLRYTSGPLEISGRLDVGIKIDESGYKTMFRLYDASFKSL
ncbi:hypothetical protein [Paenibacillus piscarius]|uniref:hypothetical protein n=1 Tax=Paenibacillus piscarius TaxID=1089681 RepID=UPI001EE7D12A|nr:hypothetical protein [Paenibacillus piscarius]